MASLPKFLQKPLNDSSRRSQKNPDKLLKASLVSLKVTVHNYTIRKIIGKNSLLPVMVFHSSSIAI